MAYPHNQAADAPEVPQHASGDRLAESQTELEAEEDPRLASDHDLPALPEPSPSLH